MNYIITDLKIIIKSKITMGKLRRRHEKNNFPKSHLVATKLRYGTLAMMENIS